MEVYRKVKWAVLWASIALEVKVKWIFCVQDDVRGPTVGAHETLLVASSVQSMYSCARKYLVLLWRQWKEQVCGHQSSGREVNCGSPVAFRLITSNHRGQYSVVWAANTEVKLMVTLCKNLSQFTVEQITTTEKGFQKWWPLWVCVCVE